MKTVSDLITLLNKVREQYGPSTPVKFYSVHDYVGVPSDSDVGARYDEVQSAHLRCDIDMMMKRDTVEDVVLHLGLF